MKVELSNRWNTLLLLALVAGLGGCNCVTSIGPPDPDPTPDPPDDIQARLVKAARVDPFANLRSLCYSSDAKYIVMEDVGDVYVVDALTLERKGDRIRDEPRGTLLVTTLATFPDRNLCACGALGEWPSTMPLVHVLTIPELDVVNKIEIPVKVINEEKIDPGSLQGFKSIQALQVSPDGRHLALRFRGGSYDIPPEHLGIWIYDTATWTLKHILTRGEDGFPGCVYEPAEFLFHPNGREMLVSFMGVLNSNVDKLTEAEIEQIEANLKQAGIRPGTQWTEVFCFDIETGERKWRLQGPAGVAPTFIYLSMPRDGALLYGFTEGVNQDSRLLVTSWKWGETKPVEQFPHPTLQPHTVGFLVSPNGKTLAFLERDLTLWSTEKRQVYFNARLPAEAQPEAATFSPDSKHLVFVQGGDVLYLVNIEPDFKKPSVPSPGAAPSPSPAGQEGGK